MNASHDNDDYRSSHLRKGADYDEALETSPLNAYLARHEARLINVILNKHFAAGVPTYLDFACGTGRITALVESRARQSYAVDVSDSMVTLARQKCKATTFIVQDITREPLRVRDVDLVTSFRFFGNAQDALRAEALAVLRDALRPGGYLLVNNHRNRDSMRNLLLRLTGQPSDGELGHFRFRKLLRRTGFDIVETCGIGAWLVLSRLRTQPRLESPKAEWFERISQLPFLDSLSPDVLFLARRR